MLVLEFSLDDNIIDSQSKDNPWLNRAAQSLAISLRLSASKKLDVKFTELVTGYRYRKGIKSSFIDIYLYDSLSSDAGYAVSVSEYIDELILDIRNFLFIFDLPRFCKCIFGCSYLWESWQEKNCRSSISFYPGFFQYLNNIISAHAFCSINKCFLIFIVFIIK